MTTALPPEFLAQPQDRVGDQVGDDRIETGRGFVVEHELGPRDDRAREAGALEHAAGELGGQIVVGLGEPHAVERIHDGAPDLRFRELGMFAQRQRDVLADGQAIEQRRELER